MPRRSTRLRARAGEMRDHGFAVERLDRAQLAQREPAIDAARLAGALYAPGDEAGDAARFCRELAARCRPLGVGFSLENEILSIEPADVRVREVVTRRGPVQRRRLRLRARRDGPQAARAARHAGAGLPGHRLLRHAAHRAPERGAAPCRRSTSRAASPSRRMGDELRVTGGAEFAGYATRAAQPADFAPLYDTMKQLFPGAVGLRARRGARLPAADDAGDHAALRHRPLPEPLVQHRPRPHGLHARGRRRAHHRRPGLRPQAGHRSRRACASAGIDAPVLRHLAAGRTPRAPWRSGPRRRSAPPAAAGPPKGTST